MNRFVASILIAVWSMGTCFVGPSKPIFAKSTRDSQDQEERPIRTGRTPAVSPGGTRVCFVYQGNLWASSIDGGEAKRLTAADANDLNPRWSADGKWIAFNSDREGGSQIFIIPSAGGRAKQITFHSTPTNVYGWFPDGKSLLVTTSRYTRRESIYRLDIETGRLKLILTEEFMCRYPALSPDGKLIAYARGALADTLRKGYKGAANYDIYIARTDGSTAPTRLTDSPWNEMWPAWSRDGKTVFFATERNKMYGLWKQSPGDKAVPVIANNPDAVRYVTANNDRIVFECDNFINSCDAKVGNTHALKLICRTDDRGPKVNNAVYNSTGASEFKLSKDGKRCAIVIRGDLFVVNVERGGEAKRITDTPTRDQELAWSPDGKTMVFSSNRNGSYQIFSYVFASGETKQLTAGNHVDTVPMFSPDGKWIIFLRGPQTGVWAIKPDGSQEQQLIAGPKITEAQWSPDGKWIAYVREDEIRNIDLFVASLTLTDSTIKASTAINVSDYPCFNQNIQWFADGKQIAFRSNRTRNRDIETINHEGKYALLSTPLEQEKSEWPADDDAPTVKDEKPKEVVVKVDPDEIERRAKQVVGLSEGISSFSVSPDCKTVLFVTTSAGQPDIWQSSIDGKDIKRLTQSGDSPSSFQWSSDSSKAYYLSNGTIKFIGRGGAGAGAVSFTARMDIDRLTDYKAVFDEAWQVLNDSFYDKTFRGQDWKAIGEKYRKLIDEVTTRNEFNYLGAQLVAELNSSHTGFSGGTPRVSRPTGFLGFIPDEDYSGPGVKVGTIIKRSPANKDESKLKSGEFILKVDGVAVVDGASFDKALTAKVALPVTLLVNDKPSETGARKVMIKPISGSSFQNLLYESWIDQRRAIVDTVSNGRLGYLHVPDMGDEARNRFERDLQSIGQRKEGMILDFRNNNGGDTHDSLLKILERNKHYFNFAPRTETPFPQPEKAYTKPIIVLINEFSLSDAEVFANGFRELKLGKILGKPTMGWIIFTYSAQLVDGSFIRVPGIGCYTLDGRDLELMCVPPDISVENTPESYRAGHDTQVERAVQELLKSLPVRKKD